jgi:hypothetical protein
MRSALSVQRSPYRNRDRNRDRKHLAFLSISIPISIAMATPMLATKMKTRIADIENMWFDV